MLKIFKPGLSACVSVLMAGMLLYPGLSYARQKPDLQQQVWLAEQAFAHTMKTRDLQQFTQYIAEEAIFFNGTLALRGKAKVVAHWASYFKDKEAPFAWQPDQVEVLESGKLALSTGLVRDPQGKVLGRFNSVWRLEADGKWRVVFDKGSPATADEQARQSQCCNKPAAPGLSFRQIL